MDMETIESLQIGLEQYPGTLIFVSHDRDLVGGLATRVIELKPGGGMTDFYDRDGKPMPDDWYNLDKHGRQYIDSYAASKRVASTEVGELHVSTVWLGLDHGFREGQTLIFETMIFGPNFTRRTRLDT